MNPSLVANNSPTIFATVVTVDTSEVSSIASSASSAAATTILNIARIPSNQNQKSSNLIYSTDTNTIQASFSTEQAGGNNDYNATLRCQAHSTLNQDELERNDISQSNRSLDLSTRSCIFLITFGFQLPLLAVFSFGNDLFFDGSLPSLALFCGFCIMIVVQLVFLVLKKSITISEIIVYSLLLVCALAITSYTYYKQYLIGMDDQKNFILNLAGMSVSGIGVVYDMAKEHKKFANRSQ